MYILLIVLLSSHGHIESIHQEHTSFEACELTRVFTVDSIAKTNKRGEFAYMTVRSQGCFKK